MVRELKNSKFFFVGIGGIGMCGLAEILHNMGAKVQGSDLNENANTEYLKKLGIKIYKGHQAENLKEDFDVLVYSSAVPWSNPELSEARKRSLPQIPRAEALAEIMRLKRGIAIAGAHGKTTTTSMVASVFLHAQMKPTIVIGGRLDLIKSTAQLGEGAWLLAEADESDGSFSKLSPEIAVITNIDQDHMEYFKNFENLKNAYLDFANRIPFYGVLIACGDDPVIRQVFTHFPKKVLYYGFDPKNDFVLGGQNRKYTLSHEGKTLGEFYLNVPGRHNALNAGAAMVCGLSAGISFLDCKKGIETFVGVDRRFHFKGEVKGIQVYDDYGHHPTEVKAVLSGFKESFPDRKLHVLFQPHRYTRTQFCWKEFTECFSLADSVCITDIYAAGESPIPGISSEILAKELKHSNSQYLNRENAFTQPKNYFEKLHTLLGKDGIFLTLGAGDIWKVGMEFLKIK